MWPDGGDTIRSYGKVKPSQVAAALAKRLGLLDPDVREQANIRALAYVWARAGGHRPKTVAIWRYGGREALSSFVVRAQREARALPQPTEVTREDAWIDESDL
jgi:hypothetical protein